MLHCVTLQLEDSTPVESIISKLDKVIASQQCLTTEVGKFNQKVGSLEEDNQHLNSQINQFQIKLNTLDASVQDIKRQINITEQRHLNCYMNIIGIPSNLDVSPIDILKSIGLCLHRPISDADIVNIQTNQTNPSSQLNKQSSKIFIQN